MRIGYDTLIENPLNPSSAIEYLARLLRALAQAAPEHEFFVFVSPKNRSRFDVKLPNVRLVNCFVSNENIPLRILVQQFYLPLLAKKHRLDVIFALNQVPLLAPCATVVKTCTLHHHLMPGEFKRRTATSLRVTLRRRLRPYYRRWMLDASARKATLVIANSFYTRDSIAASMGAGQDKIRVVYETVHEDFGSMERQDARNYARDQFGFLRDYVLYVSNLWFYKNPEGAICAFAQMWKRYGEDMDLVIAGPDDYNRTPELRALAERQGISARMRFTGRLTREQLVPLYAAARAVLYPSFAETFGKPVLEAMQSGVPLVAAHAACLPEIAGGAALLADPNDDAEMAEALHRAISDEDVRARLIESGFKRSCEFTWERAAGETLEVCLEAMVLHSNTGGERTRISTVAAGAGCRAVKHE